MKKHMNAIWSSDNIERQTRLKRLKEIRVKLQRGHSRFHDDVLEKLKYLGNFISELDIDRYTVDLICIERKLIVECYGDFWHANSLKFNEMDVVKLPGREILAKDIWSKDQKRIDRLQELGYDVVIVWQSDWIKDPVCVLKIIKEKLNNV